jgi:hypothetical protein
MKGGWIGHVDYRDFFAEIADSAQAFRSAHQRPDV